MSNINLQTPSFVFGYWRPWNEKSTFSESYLDYVKDVSLVKYGADVVGKYIQSASKEQIKAIENLGKTISGGLDILSDKLNDVKSELRFLNANTEILIDQQRLSNILLEDIIELLRVPDSEKERQHAIELGVKFFINAQKDSTLFDDALEQFVKAEGLMKQDYFVLHRIGCIHLYVEKHLNIEKALSYFLRSAKYSSVETAPDAVRLANALTENTLNTQKRLEEINGFVDNLNWETYPELMKVNVIGLSYEEDTLFVKIAERIEFDPFFEEAAELVVDYQQGSTSFLQRKLNLGYNQAGRLIDQLEKSGIVGSFNGSKLREIFVSDKNLLKLKLKKIKQDPDILKMITMSQYDPEILPAYELIIKHDSTKTEINKIRSIIDDINLKHQYFGINSIKAITSDSFQKAAFCSYILGKYENAVSYQQNATDLIKSPENLYLLSKYQARNNQVTNALINLDTAIDLMPIIILAVFKEIDLMNVPEIVELVGKRNDDINKNINELIEKWKNIKSKIAQQEIVKLSLSLESSYDKKVNEHNKSNELLEYTIQKINIQKKEIDQTISDFNSKIILESSVIDNLNKLKGQTLEEMEMRLEEFEENLNEIVVSIGSKYQGGIVFHIDNTGKHGLIFAEIELGEAVWGAKGTFNTDSKIGSGKENTELIFKNASFIDEINWFKRIQKPIETAAKTCFNLNYNDFNDWFLPSIDELEILYNNIHKAGLFKFKTNKSYWSSSESNELQGEGNYNSSRDKEGRIHWLFNMRRRNNYHDNTTLSIEKLNALNAWHFDFDKGSREIGLEVEIKAGFLGIKKDLTDSSRVQKLNIIAVRSF